MNRYECKFCHKLLFKIKPLKNDDTKIQLIIDGKKRETIATHYIEIRCLKCKRDNKFSTPYENIYKARIFNDAFAEASAEKIALFT